MKERMFSLQMIFTFALSVIGFASAGGLYPICCALFGYATMRFARRDEEGCQVVLDFVKSTWTAIVVAVFPSAIFHSSSGYLNKCEWLFVAGAVFWFVGICFGLAEIRAKERRAKAAVHENMPFVA